MITRFQDFDLINENMSKARAVLRQVGKTQTDTEFAKLRNLLGNNLGYIGKFTEWMFLNKVEYKQIEALYNRIKDVRLAKPIDQFNTPEEVIDTLIRKNTETDLNQMLNAIPSNTRQMLRDCDDFGDLENFLTQHADKKSSIIDFFSKKSGRYGEYLEQVVDAKSIAEISQLSKTSSIVKFVYEDDKVLVVAVDYDGIQEVGSRYWCTLSKVITEDEYTFSDYVLEADRPNIQLAIYFKDKIPFVDDQSVLGVTWDLQQNRIYAAHWEDDDEYNQIRKGSDPIVELLKPLNAKMFELGKSLYDWHSANWFWSIPSLYQEETNKAKAEFEKTGKTKSFDSLLNGYLDWLRDDDRLWDAWGQPFIKDFIELIKSLGIKIELDLDTILICELEEIAKFNKSFLNDNIFGLIEDYSIDRTDQIERIFKWLKANGYDFWHHVHSVQDAVFAIENGVIKPEKFFDKFGWDELNDDIDDAEVVVSWAIENRLKDLIKAILSRGKSRFDLGQVVVDMISHEPLKYKSEIIELLSDSDTRGNFAKSHILEILKLGDNELRSMAATSLIPKELSDYFDVQLTPKVASAKKVESAPKKKKK